MNVKNDFKMLDKSLIYFDSAATSFKPNSVVESIVDYYTNYTANAHRGDYDAEVLKELWRYEKTGQYTDSQIREALDMAIKALEHPEKNVIAIMPCGDAISREDALMCATGEIPEGGTYEDALKTVAKRLQMLPPVDPEQKAGHWTREEHPDAMPTFTVTWRCSVCGKDQSYGEPPFCPNCGSYNGGDEE